MSHDFTISEPMTFEEAIAHHQASFEGKEDPFWNSLSPEEQTNSRNKLRDDWLKHFGDFKNEEFRFFRSDEESWSLLGGREGYAIVKGGKVVEVYPTAMN